MSSRVIRHSATLQRLAKADPRVRRQLLHRGSSDLVKAICECARNVLAGNVPLNTGQKLRLKKYRKPLREIVKKKTPLYKKKIIIQRGGFLSALIGPLIGAVLPALTSLFHK